MTTTVGSVSEETVLRTVADQFGIARAARAEDEKHLLWDTILQGEVFHKRNNAASVKKKEKEESELSRVDTTVECAYRILTVTFVREIDTCSADAGSGGPVASRLTTTAHPLFFPVPASKFPFSLTHTPFLGPYRLSLEYHNHYVQHSHPRLSFPSRDAQQGIRFALCHL